MEDVGETGYAQTHLDHGEKNRDRGGEHPEVGELPPIEPVVTEYRLHRLICQQCGEKTCGQLPAGVPCGAFGPRLQAVLSLLAGA